MALSPVELSIAGSTAVQVATSFTNILAPASIGGTALLARFLYRRGATAAAAAAAVAMVYATSAAGSCATILVAAFATGQRITIADRLPLPTVLAITAAVAAVTCGLTWVALHYRSTVLGRIVGPVTATLRQCQRPCATRGEPGRHRRRPGRAARLGTHPGRLHQGVRPGGVPAQRRSGLTIGTAIRQHRPGAGGIGPVEASLVAGLVVAGAETPTACSG